MSGMRAHFNMYLPVAVCVQRDSTFVTQVDVVAVGPGGVDVGGHCQGGVHVAARRAGRAHVQVDSLIPVAQQNHLPIFCGDVECARLVAAVCEQPVCVRVRGHVLQHLPVGEGDIGQQRASPSHDAVERSVGLAHGELTALGEDIVERECDGGDAQHFVSSVEPGRGAEPVPPQAHRVMPPLQRAQDECRRGESLRVSLHHHRVRRCDVEPKHGQVVVARVVGDGVLGVGERKRGENLGGVKAERPAAPAFRGAREVLDIVQQQ
mmetsp:Transcript_34154/g.80497  ORF Transcript_34154/g.80497 Transcript_34154/m.80497 type:complete len:264 (+) Transcript_34154:1021-1812(+)